MTTRVTTRVVPAAALGAQIDRYDIYAVYFTPWRTRTPSNLSILLHG